MQVGNLWNWKGWGAIALALGCLLWIGNPAIAQIGLPPPRVPTEAITVDYAPSAQTIALLYPLPRTHLDRIRLEALMAPDPRQAPWGPEARACAQTLIPRDATLHLEVPTPPRDGDADPYGRLWGYVRLPDHRLLNAALLAEGCAVLNPNALATSPYATTLIHSQERARILGLGLWNRANPWRPPTPEPTPLIPE